MSTTRPARHRWFDHAPILDAANKVVIDESGANEAYDFAITAASENASFNVDAKGRTSGDVQSYLSVDDLTVIGTINNDTFALNAAPLAAGAVVSLDGEGGYDTLAIDFSARALDFSTSQDGVSSVAGGSFRGFEKFDLTLGDFENIVTTGDSNDFVRLTGSKANTISTGGGDDIVYDREYGYGISGADQIDFGLGVDKWYADFRKLETPLIFNYIGDDITISNGAVATGVERFSIGLGKLNDIVYFSGAFSFFGGDSIFLNGREGYDTLNFDGSLVGSSLYFRMYYYDDAYLIIGSDNGSGEFDSFFSSYLTGSRFDDVFSGEYDGISDVNAIDGGEGFDTFSLTRAYSMRLVVEDDGAISTNLFEKMASIERFVITESYGTIIAGTADDILSGGGTFFGRGGDDHLTGLYTSDDILGGGSGDDFIDGGAGIDTASYWDAGSAVIVALVARAQDTGGAGIDALANIENLTGSDFNDRLTGNSAANVLEGGRGNDLLDGGLGLDTASYAGALSAVRVDLAIVGAQKTAGAGQDTLLSIENLTGSAFDDVLAGNAGDNVLAGGLGYDLVSYAGATQGVTVDLRVVGAQDTGYGRDTLSGFEAIVGSVYNDTLNGDFQDNILEGGAGDDTLDGTTGVDTASYAHAAAGVTVSLALTTAQDTGGAGVDTLRNIEALAGSAFADVLNGGALGDRLSGGDGDDRLTGAGGADTLDGGVGVDTAVYTGGPWAQYDVVATADGYEITRVGAPDNHDTLTAVERVSFDGQTFAIAATVNVGPKARADKGPALQEAGDAGPGVASARGDVLVNDRDANLKTEGLGEQLHVAAAGTAPGALTDVADTLTVQGTYGTLVIDDDGSYRYKLDNRLPATDHLHAGDTATERFFYEVADVHGATSVTRLTFLVAGADDAGQAAEVTPILFHPVAHDFPLLVDGQMHV